VTEEPSASEQHPEEETTPEHSREDWFARQLGEEWVEIEPGIYRQAEPPAQSPYIPVDEVDLDDPDAIVRDLSLHRTHGTDAPESRRGGRWWRRG
jgi:hypothetical protein